MGRIPPPMPPAVREELRARANAVRATVGLPPLGCTVEQEWEHYQATQPEPADYVADDGEE
jgi:hypothetical protein